MPRHADVYINDEFDDEFDDDFDDDIISDEDILRDEIAQLAAVVDHLFEECTTEADINILIAVESAVIDGITTLDAVEHYIHLINALVINLPPGSAGYDTNADL